MKPLKEQLSVKIYNIQVRSLTFSLDDNLAQAGQAFLADLLNHS